VIKVNQSEGISSGISEGISPGIIVTDSPLLVPVIKVNHSEGISSGIVTAFFTETEFILDIIFGF